MKYETVTIEVVELERAFEPLMCLRAILSSAGSSSADIDAEDVAEVLRAILYSAYKRTGYPVRWDTLQ